MSWRRSGEVTSVKNAELKLLMLNSCLFLQGRVMIAHIIRKDTGKYSVYKGRTVEPRLRRGAGTQRDFPLPSPPGCDSCWFTFRIFFSIRENENYVSFCFIWSSKLSNRKSFSWCQVEKQSKAGLWLDFQYCKILQTKLKDNQTDFQIYNKHTFGISLYCYESVPQNVFQCL